MKDKKFVALAGVFFLLFLIGITAVVLEKPVSNIIKASTANPSPHRSWGTVFPQIAPVGKESNKVKVAVYVMDVNGVALSGRSVKLTADGLNVIITPSDTQVTDQIGMVQYFVSSDQPGKVKLHATDLASKTDITNIPSLEFVK